ncbi:amidohydrolase family protein [Kribbella italica]|uniref:Imidazolonepropionase-like amidohydrolase n=1 Tax=Kribbella italica TaxID=1540520 RepID=A0A7W9JC85_9ACTN|nr:amidohydrolase family protein [Kribbella italica]MBB5839065.1 imidazolonepropionase-like amidohydrolase [Kribbella italica]
MTTWTFDGVSLPVDKSVRLRFGTGDEEKLPGRFALPGLVDAHCHLTVDADEKGPLLTDSAQAEDRLDQLAQAGVSAVRDVGGRREITLRFAREPREDRPIVLAAGRFLAPEGRYFPRLHDPVEADELLAAVEAELNDGATWVKLVADFPAVGPDGPIRGSAIEPTYEIGLIEQVVATVHAKGGRVAAHTNGTVVSELVRAGVDSIEHGTVITERDLEVLGARGGAWTPTLSASIDGRPDETPEQRDRRRTKAKYLTSMLELADRYGVTVLTGSDAVGSVAREIELLTQHGLDATQAMAAATTKAWDYLGLLDDGGNLVTYDEDPREHPETLVKPAAVILHGHRIR